jgi:hypothetical protein
MYYVSLFCSRAIWLSQGKVVRDGPAAEVVTAYEEYLVNREKRKLDAEGAGAGAAELPHGQEARIRRIRLLDEDDAEVDRYRPGMDLVVEVEWEAVNPETSFHLGVAVERGDGTRVLAAATFLDELPTRSGSGVHRDRLRFVGLPMAKGNYSVTGYIFDPSGLHIWDQAVITECLKPADESWALAMLKPEHRWELEGDDG